MNPRLLGLALMLSAFLVLLHQYMSWGCWFELPQFLHHENIAVALFALGFGVLAYQRIRCSRLT